jgi:hypothetical protein
MIGIDNLITNVASKRLTIVRASTNTIKHKPISVDAQSYCFCLATDPTGQKMHQCPNSSLCNANYIT